MDWLKGTSSPETIDFPRKIMGLSMVFHGFSMTNPLRIAIVRPTAELRTGYPWR